MKKNKEKDHFKDTVRGKLTDREMNSEKDSELWARVLEEIRPEAKIVRLNYTWYAAAAAVLILLTAGIVVYKYSGSNDVHGLSKVETPGKTDPVAGEVQTASADDQREENKTGMQTNQKSVPAVSGISNAAAAPIDVHAENTSLAYNLPDGSVVTLNQGAVIKAAASFTDKRDLAMEGEAYFEVQSDKSRPFTVYFADCRLVVVGTKFNVRNVSGEHMKEVTVTEGIVRVFAKGDEEGIEVRKGQQLRIADNVQPELSEVDPFNYIAWKTGALDFSKTTLKQVADILSRQYGREVEVSDKVKNCKFTGDLSGLTLDEAIKVVSITSTLKIERSGNKIYLTGSGCD